MGGKIRHKDRFGCTPRKGTKLRAFLRLALRPQGVTAAEAAVIFGTAKLPTQCIRALRDEKGWDVRAFNRKCLGQDISEGDHSYVIYRCVGKMKWDGSYRSFVRGD